MDFKSYYRQRLIEDAANSLPLDPDAPVQQTQADARNANNAVPESDDPEDAVIPQSSLYNVIKLYASKDPQLKISMATLAADITNALWRYSALEYAKKDAFDSPDDWKKYKKMCRDKVAETYGDTMKELFINIGKFVANTANTIASK